MIITMLQKNVKLEYSHTQAFSRFVVIIQMLNCTNVRLFFSYNEKK
jgi:hypothetical protein